MTCFMGKGDMKDATTTYLDEYNNQVLVIKNVPCHKCTQCGEISYSGTVVKELERIRDNIANTPTEVAVLNYTA